MSLPGMNQQDTLAMAAAFSSAKVSNADINWEKAAQLMGSKSVAGARERVRVAKKKAKSHGQVNTATATAVSNAPAGGVDKKSPNKVKHQTPKKTTKVTKVVAQKVKEEQDAEDSAVGEIMDDEA